MRRCAVAESAGGTACGCHAANGGFRELPESRRHEIFFSGAVGSLKRAPAYLTPSLVRGTRPNPLTGLDLCR